MAASPIAAIKALYSGLTAANFPGASRPPVYFGESPLYDGQQVRPPYVVVRDDGLTAEHEFEANVIEDGGLTVEVYADTLEDVDMIVKAIRWNGQSPGQRAGFDFAAPSLDSPYTGMALVFRTAVRKVAGVGLAGQRTHMATMTYTLRATVQA